MTARQARRGRRTGYKKLYILDDCSQWIWAKVKNASRSVDFNMMMDDALMAVTRKGVPWKCLLANGIMAAAAADPKLFNHPVMMAYVEGSKVFIMVTNSSTKRATVVPQAVCYRHNFTKQLRGLDNMTRTQFMEQFGGKSVEIRLRPPRRQTTGGPRKASNPQPGRAPTEKEGGEPRLVGAMRRAKDAGLLNMPSEMFGGSSPTS